MEAGAKFREFPITWERGLIESVEDSMLPPGSAALLRNWVPDTAGNLRARVGWTRGSTTSAPSTRKGWGIGHLALQRRPYIRQSATATDPSGVEPNTVTATWGAATVSGSCLVARLYLSDQSSRAASAFTITPPTDWVSAVTPAGGGRNAHCWIYYKPNAASESSTVAFTVEIGGVTDTLAMALEISELRNVVAASPVDVTDADDDGTSTTPEVGPTGAPAVPVGIAMAAFSSAFASNGTYSAPTNGYALDTEFFVDSGASDLNAVGAHKTFTDGAAQTVGVTLSTTPGSSCSLLVAFKATDFAATDGVYIVANNEDPDMKLYYIDREDVGGGTWNLLQTHSSTDADVVPFAFTSGNEKSFWVHPSLTGTWQWGGLSATAPAVISGSPVGRCVAWHKSRLYVGGSSSEPWKLHFSDVDDHTDWTGGTAGSINVGLGDGEAIEDILPFEDGLLIGKQTSLWFLIGSGPGTHKLIRIPQGGCAPGRTLLATDYGAIVAGKHEVHLYTNGEARLISRPIRDSYGITGNFLTCSVRDESAYICDEGSGTIWVIDFAAGGTWREETVGSASTEGPAVIFNQGRDQLFAPKNASVGSLLNYRMIPGSSRTKDFTGITQTYEAWTPEMWLAGPSKKFTPMFLFLKIRQRAGDAGDGALTITPYINGTADTAMTVSPEATAGVRWYRKRITNQAGIFSLQLRATHTLASTDTAVMDLEEWKIGYSFEERR